MASPENASIAKTSTVPDPLLASFSSSLRPSLDERLVLAELLPATAIFCERWLDRRRADPAGRRSGAGDGVVGDQQVAGLQAVQRDRRARACLPRPTDDFIVGPVPDAVLLAGRDIARDRRAPGALCGRDRPRSGRTP